MMMLASKPRAYLFALVGISSTTNCGPATVGALELLDTVAVEEVEAPEHLEDRGPAIAAAGIAPHPDVAAVTKGAPTGVRSGTDRSAEAEPEEDDGVAGLGVDPTLLGAALMRPQLPHTKHKVDDTTIKSVASRSIVDIGPGPLLPGFVTSEINQCEGFRVVTKADGKSRHRRNRKKWYNKDRDRFRELVRMVAREMGADDRLLALWSMRESSWNPTALHVLNPDLEGSISSWKKHRYDAEREAKLEAKLAKTSARSPEFYRIRAQLKRLRKFKDNPYYEHKTEYEVHLPDGEVLHESSSSWAYGYGPFGMNPTLFLPMWDSTAPPWIFCSHSGIPAIITAVWSARQAQKECQAQGFEGTFEDVNRRFSSGHCRPRPSRAPLFHARAKRNGIDHTKIVNLGKKWPRASTKTIDVFTHMVETARAEGLLTERWDRPGPFPEAAVQSSDVSL